MDEGIEEVVESGVVSTTLGIHIREEEGRIVFEGADFHVK